MDSYISAGSKHYLTGLSLLSLEDQVTGLIDAAFMQFYQGCELLCRDSVGGIENSKKYIAKLALEKSRELQIIAHHIWRVRNKYFGHGDVLYNEMSNQNVESVIQVAKQVLVARYLCKQLLDAHTPSRVPLVREMGLFSENYSGDFRGQVGQIENTFRADYDRRSVKIYDLDGNKIEDYDIK